MKGIKSLIIPFLMFITIILFICIILMYKNLTYKNCKVFVLHEQICNYKYGTQKWNINDDERKEEKKFDEWIEYSISNRMQLF